MGTIDDVAASRLMALLEPYHDAARVTSRRLCRSNSDGDDLFQETLLRALDKLGELREEARFRAWFYAVMLSVHRMRHRRGFWRRLVPLDGEDRIEAEAVPAAPGVASFEGAEVMARALSALSPEAREAIVLFEIEGFSLEEIAAMQGASLSAVKSRLVRARERLAREYERLAGAAPHAASRRPTGELS